MNRTKNSSTNGTRPKKKAILKAATRPAKKAKKELTADELTFLAWQDTYAKRHKRVA